MKQKSSTKTIIRMDLDKGEYSTLSTFVLKNPKLTEAAKVLLMLILNNKESWDISLSYYSNMLGWSSDKQSAAKKNLEDNGYLTTYKNPAGEKGFNYYYTVSEYGNLKPKESTQSTVTPPAEQVVTIPVVTTPTVILSQSELDEKIIDFIIAAINDCSDSTFIDFITPLQNKLNSKYKKGDLFFNDELTSSIKNEYEDYKEKSSSIDLVDLIDKNITKGTIAQRKTIKEKALDYFNNITEYDEYDIKQKVFKIQNSIITANRVMNNYQN